ncbi:MAG: hypothetical protein EZS28_047383 [Streblomastix strix]|uniref:Uncharacterized protein n=1 Tax=Streblomastix strix TaxID=222440 RepID=A0A5J4THP8_9EUKA|nr:MAG: hypothetical protein EZS28_047383 [Streblomastix strix]
MLRRGNALDRQIVTNGRIVVIGSYDTESTIIPPPAFHHQSFVEPHPNRMSVIAEIDEDFEELLYGLSDDLDYRKSKYQLIIKKNYKILCLGLSREKQDWGIDWEGYGV